MLVQPGLHTTGGWKRKITAYRASGEKTPSAIDLHRELNVLKKTEFSWMYEVSKCAPQEALRDLDKAFAHFFRRVKEKKSGKNIKVGFPRFKSKKRGLGSFRLTGAIRVFEKAIQLPRLGELRPAEQRRLYPECHAQRKGRTLVCVRSRLEMEIPDPVMERKPVAGVDLGINRLAQVE